MIRKSRFFHCSLLVVCCGIVTGCGPNLIKVRGKVLKDGQPFKPDRKGDRLQVGLFPYDEGGRSPTNGFPAKVNSEDSAFEVIGKGILPGKYRIVVRVGYGREDQDRLGEAFGLIKSPFIREIVNEDEIVIDLAKPDS